MATAGTTTQRTAGNPDISWLLERPTHRNGGTSTSPTEGNHQRLDDSDVISPFNSVDIFPGQPKALDGIVLRGFLLGITFGIATLTTITLAYYGVRLWRIPFFVASLSLFHLLEFWVTARYNTPKADMDAFLLSSNGKAWNIAHTSALLECLLTSLFLPGLHTYTQSAPLLTLGLTAMLIGQVTRSSAMAHAGTNFNHQVQKQRAEGHRLVTTEIYGYLRHPSYFGFFWWGVGTQVVLGNVVCLGGYAYVLWSFFNRRIMREEEYLVEFFGEQYERYRERSRVGIPFIG